MPRFAPSLPDLAAYVLIGAGVGFLPFFYSSATFDPALSPRFLILAGLVLLLTLLLAFIKREHVDFSVLRRRIFAAGLVYALCAMLALLPARNLGESIFELIKILLALVFLIIATLVLAGKWERFMLLTKMMTLCALMLATIGICQYYFLAFNFIPGNFLVYATMANRNLFSSALFLALPFLLFGALHFSRFWRALSLTAFGLVAFTLVITHTRAVWLACGAATLAGIILCVKHFRDLGAVKKFYMRRLGLTVVMAAAMIVLAWLAHARQSSSDARVASSFARPRSSVQERWALWTKTAQMIKDHPLSGVGLGHWKVWLPHYGAAGLRSETGTVHFQRPHNDYLWVLAETGPAGLLAYCAMFIALGVYGLKIMRFSFNQQEKIFAALVLCGVSGYLVIALFDFPKERIEHTVWLSLMMATLVSLYHRAHPAAMTSAKLKASLIIPPLRGARGVLRSILAEVKRFRRAQEHAPNFPQGGSSQSGLVFRHALDALGKIFSGKRFFLSSAAFIACAALIAGSFRVAAEIHTVAALQARAVQDWPRVIAEIDHAESFFAPMDPTATPLAWYRGVAHFSMNNVAAALRDFRRAHEVHPHHLHVLNNLATCYELQGEHAQAIFFYKKALAISPRFEESLINLSAVYYNLKAYRAAQEILARCDSNSTNPKIPEYLTAITSKLTKGDSL